MAILLLTCGACCCVLWNEEPQIIAEGWDYAPAMRRVAAESTARPGVVLHIGDSITYANPYGQWARNGAGRDAADQAALQWMHAGAEDESDGWRLARFDHPDGGRSYTACGGVRLDEMLAGGKNGMPSLAEILAAYHPQAVVFMLGTNDAAAGRSAGDFARDYAKAVETILRAGAAPIVSTIPPHPRKTALAKSYNEVIREIAAAKTLPLIDYEREILSRRPDDWNGTLLGMDDVHPSTDFAGVKPTDAPTKENLRSNGYLLRGWLSVRKIAEVKARVFDRTEVKSAKTIKLPINRDNWFSTVGAEADGNNGGASRLKFKSIQEMSIVDFDPTPLRGRKVKSAMLFLRLAGDEQLHRVTVGTIGAEWAEGTESNYTPQPGASTFNRRRHPEVFWTTPGSDLCSVILGQGGTFWRTADAAPPDKRGWQKIPVDPAVLAARVAGISYGMLVFDDTGSEWRRNGEKFDFRLYPNRFAYSREGGAANAPYLQVELGEVDAAPPGTPSDVQSKIEDLPAGEALVSWITPTDKGAGVLGFHVEVDGKPVPRYLIPVAKKPGERVELHLRDLEIANTSARLEVRAVDGAGNLGEPATAVIPLSQKRLLTVPGPQPVFAAEGGPLPRLGEGTVAVVDELDKVHPVTGKMIPAQPEGYLTANHLWNAKTPRINLYTGRNEFTAFQIVLDGRTGEVEPRLSFNGAEGIETTFRRYRCVKSKDGPLPDPIVPLTDPIEAIEGRRLQSLHCEIYTPHDAKPGDRQGVLSLQAGGEKLELPVTLHVWHFTLPDQLSFLPEMNGYGLPAAERGYYRLGHLHRTIVNIVPYSQGGVVADGWAPRWNNGRFDWSAWDKRFGPYFSGAAFADLPRKGVPLECHYLALHENWPTPMAGNYNGDYWADRAFPPDYRAAFIEASRQYAEHLNGQGWNETLFQGFLNNKVDFKRKGWSRGSSPWLLDEPANFQDFQALRYFGSAFHEGAALAPGMAKLVYRADVSRPMWQRDSLDGVLDYNVIGSDFRRYRRMVLDRKRAQGQIVVEYGTANGVEESNLQGVAWSLDAWSLGADGVLPWLTIGAAEAWSEAEATCLFYPPRAGETEPTASIRLKAYRRGQQDVEYLTLLGSVLGEPRWAVGEAVRRMLKLSGRRQGTGFDGEDAGSMTYGSLRPQDLWTLRVQIGDFLSATKPEPRKRLVDFRTPPRGPVLSQSPLGESAGTSKPSAVARLMPQTIQGRNGTRETLIDFERPDDNFASATREIALKKNAGANAYLVQFDLRKLQLDASAPIEKATLSFYIWDPSSQGRTKVCAFPLFTAWDEASANWKRPAAGRSWKEGATFSLAEDAGAASPPVVVAPDKETDVVDPPLEYQLDVTAIVNGWSSGRMPNRGVAIAPVADRSIDEGFATRFQIYSSRYADGKYGPKLTVWRKK